MNTIDPDPNQNADLATLFHITKSPTISQRPSQPFCPSLLAPVYITKVNHLYAKN
jgi:hypothetical protein